MADISIVNVLMDYMHDYLLLKMTTEITQEDTDVGLVKVGKLQDDPTTYMKNLLIRPAEDAHVIHEDGHNGITVGATYLVGGGYQAFWWRKFEIQFSLFFIGESDRDVARRKTNVIMSRAQHTINNMPMPTWNSTDGTFVAPNTQQDSFGESPSMCVNTSTKFHEGGGPGDFIWRGEMNVEWLTEISN